MKKQITFSAITVSEAVKVGKVYSIDGKRVSKSAKVLLSSMARR